MLEQLPNSLLQQRKSITLKAKRLLFSQGETPEYLYFLESGEIQLNRSAEQGTSCILQRIQRGFFAEASLFAAHYHCDAYSNQDCRLSAFPISYFRQQLGQDGFYEVWIQMLSKEIKRLRNQSERLSLNSAADKILHYIATEGEKEGLRLQGTKKEWANELGLSHETLYRTLKSLEQQGRIKTEILSQQVCIKLPKDFP
jgi:CRP-like cAMP-binding protein